MLPRLLLTVPSCVKVHHGIATLKVVYCYHVVSRLVPYVHFNFE